MSFVHSLLKLSSCRLLPVRMSAQQRQLSVADVVAGAATGSEVMPDDSASNYGAADSDTYPGGLLTVLSDELVPALDVLRAATWPSQSRGVVLAVLLELRDQQFSDVVIVALDLLCRAGHSMPRALEILSEAMSWMEVGAEAGTLNFMAQSHPLDAVDLFLD